jgi:hypothetical protein
MDLIHARGPVIVSDGVEALIALVPAAYVIERLEGGEDFVTLKVSRSFGTDMLARLNVTAAARKLGASFAVSFFQDDRLDPHRATFRLLSEADQAALAGKVLFAVR